MIVFQFSLDWLLIVGSKQILIKIESIVLVKMWAKLEVSNPKVSLWRWPRDVIWQVNQVDIQALYHFEHISSLLLFKMRREVFHVLPHFLSEVRIKEIQKWSVELFLLVKLWHKWLPYTLLSLTVLFRWLNFLNFVVFVDTHQRNLTLIFSENETNVVYLRTFEIHIHHKRKFLVLNHRHYHFLRILEREFSLYLLEFVSWKDD